MSIDFEELGASLKRSVWGGSPNAMPVLKAWGLRTARVVWVLAGELMSGELTMRAMGLVYTTLLSLVPLLAFTFSVLKGFGVHNQLEPVLANFLAPLGEQGVEITNRIIEFVENVKVGVLGSIGLGLLIYTVISLLSKIEQSFNYIWHVERARPIGQRFSEYISVLLVGPVLVFAALGITATMMNAALIQEAATIEPVGALIRHGAKLVPYLLVIGAFTFVYMFMPNTRVHLLAALTGGVVAGVLWQTVGWLFSAIVVGSTKYTAIYSSFAIVIIFMIWLFVSWLILLFGASVSFLTQHPENLVPERKNLWLSSRLRRKAALLLMLYIGRRFLDQGKPPTLEELARFLSVPVEATRRVLESLRSRDFVVEVCGETPGYLPGKDPGSLRLSELMRAVDVAGESEQVSSGLLPQEPAVDRLLDDLFRRQEEVLADATLRALILADKDAPPPAPEPSAPVAAADRGGSERV